MLKSINIINRYKEVIIIVLLENTIYIAFKEFILKFFNKKYQRQKVVTKASIILYKLEHKNNVGILF